MPKTCRPPAYRRRLIRGREVAYLRLTDAKTKRVIDVWLGPYGSAESRETYARHVAEWESRGRRILSSHATPEGSPSVSKSEPTVAQIAHRFWVEAAPRYSSSERGNFECVIRLLRAMFGSLTAASFGPNALRLLRHAMIRGDEAGSSSRRPWCRSTANHMVRRVRQIFKRAASIEILPVTTYQALRTLEPIRRGIDGVRESRLISCVESSCVNRVKAVVAPQIAAMFELQLLTGMRPGEVCAIRPCDIDMSGKVWRYQPREHKMSQRGKERTVYLGPRAQRIVKRFLAGRPTDAFLFSPAEATAWQRAKRHEARKTRPSWGNRPGTHCQSMPLKRPGDRYTKDSYRRAIDYGCTKAGVPHWHPHPLRHNCATDIRKKYGLEAARILLSHSSALITEVVYAERDMEKAQQIARGVG